MKTWQKKSDSHDCRSIIRANKANRNGLRFCADDTQKSAKRISRRCKKNVTIPSPRGLS